MTRVIAAARKALGDFVDVHLGFGHITRQEIIDSHTSDFATAFFSHCLSESAILVLDGTYVYIQKSQNYTLRRCFSMQKKRPLVKAMVVTATDGYIISVIGPYMSDGKNNDANITVHMMKTNADNRMDWLTEEDILVLDRGFRDALPFLNDCGFQTESPDFLSKTQKQFTTTSANKSRMVTKVRWVVEAVNGRLKKWKYFDRVIPNTNIPNIRDNLRIVAAICNKYLPPIRSGQAEDFNLAINMLKELRQNNDV